MNNKKNLFSAVVCQVVTMLSGLILPRLIIGTFGSEVNGLISSITQFVSFISLLEGGLGAVVLAELYKPIEDRDFIKIKSILTACQHFFSKLGLIFLGYSIILSMVYPLIINNSMGLIYTGTLVLILSFTTLVQYLFSITNSLYLQANQKLYVVNYVSAFITVCNLLIAVVVIKVFPQIHILKIMAGVLFLIQPFVLRYYVKKDICAEIKLPKEAPYVLKNRWSGFAQNFAHFVNMNTDIVIITVFVGLAGVSVYSIYMLAINALRTIVSMLSNSYQSALGKYYASNDMKLMKSRTISFDRINTQISLILYGTCLLLINPFVLLYTKGIADTNYYQPAFALVMVFANLLYCIREPYRYVVLAAGKFKETNIGAIIEAILNVVISIILINKLGLLGVAIGTLFAILYRYIYFIVFLKKNILFLPLKLYFFRMSTIFLICGINVFLYLYDWIPIKNIASFIAYGCVAFIAQSVITVGLFWIEGKLSNWLINRSA